MNDLYFKDTIYAPATPTGGAIAIIRISGADAHAVLARVFRSRAEGQVRYGTLYTADGAPVDRCLALVFEAGHSYTDEAYAELQIHGGAGVMQAALSALHAAGAREAEAGEFTRRAYLNGKLSLLEAEAIAAVISAETERAARCAARELTGGMTAVKELEARLIAEIAAIEAAYEEDFPDDTDISGLVALEKDISYMISTGRAASRLTGGSRVVIAGAPNAGKSSLMNALLGRDRAIVAPVAGTTRDVVTEATAICGIPVLLTDTAGLHASSDAVEAEGIARAETAIQEADAIIAAVDASLPPSAETLAWLSSLPRCTVALCKSDLPVAAGLPDGIVVSSVTGEGMDALKAAVADALSTDGGDAARLSGDRQLRALEAAKAAIASAIAAPDDMCRAVDLRDALAAVSGLTGADADEAVIDAVFSKFCIGK